MIAAGNNTSSSAGLFADSSAWISPTDTWLSTANPVMTMPMMMISVWMKSVPITAPSPPRIV